jgi:serine protease inhibitor
MALALLIATQGCQEEIENIADYNIRSEDEALIEVINSYGLQMLSTQVQEHKTQNIIPLNQFQLMGLLLNASDEPWHQEMLANYGVNDKSADEVNNSLKRILETMRQKMATFSSTVWYKNNIVLNNDFMESSTFFFNTNFYAHAFNSELEQEVETQLHLTSDTQLEKSLHDCIADKSGIIATNFLTRLQPEGSYSADSMLFNGQNATIRMPSVVISSQGHYYADEAFHFVEIPTATPDVYLNLFIPHGTDNIEAALTAVTAERWANCRRESQEEVYNLEIPDFNTDCLYSTNKTIPAMGTTLISESSPEMDSSQVSVLAHIKLEFDLERDKRRSDTKRMIVADKPLIYLIYEKKSNCILASGTFFANP